MALSHDEIIKKWRDALDALLAERKANPPPMTIDEAYALIRELHRQADEIGWVAANPEPIAT
jgi:hypothetical protein